MKTLIFQWACCMAMAWLPGAVMAEKADRSKPMHIEADALRYDDNQQTSVFNGRVVLSKGTMLIRGAYLEARQDPQGNQFGLIKAEAGKLAYFRQKRESRPGGPDEFIEGEAEVIEYDGKADTVRFLQRAQLRRLVGTTLQDEMSGAVIVYDNTSSVLTVDGGPAKSATRVRAMLTPRVDESRSALPAPGPAASVPALRRSATLGGDKK